MDDILALRWGLLGAVFLDEVFAQVKDDLCVWLQLDSSFEQYAAASGVFDIDQLLAMFGCTLEEGALTPTKRSADHVSAIGSTLLPALAPWSVPGSWVAWVPKQPEHFTFVTMALGEPPAARLGIVERWGPLQERIAVHAAALGISRVQARIEVIDAAVRT